MPALARRVEIVQDSIRRCGLPRIKTIVDQGMYDFTRSWFFDVAKPIWDDLIPQLRPARILEIGSFEGASACYLIDALAAHQPLEIHCIDTWHGGAEHQAGGAEAADMAAVEARFNRNIDAAMARAAHAVEIKIHKGPSHLEMPKLLAGGMGDSFDFIYIDGSHCSEDVLLDAVLSFRLARIGGLIVFDDYLWTDPGKDARDLNPVDSPKPAIDAFTGIYCRRISILRAPLYQLYVVKTS